MNDVNTVEISELKLYYEINPNIPFNMKKDSFVSYLKDLREFDKKSRPSDVVILSLNFLAVFTFGVFSVLFFAEAVSQIMKVFQNTFLISDRDYLLTLGIPRLFVAPVSIFAYLLAGSIMLLADIFVILSLVLGVHKKWTNYHRQLLILAENLQEKDILEDFFVSQKENKTFQMVKCSIEWEMEWVFPFLFQNFPPYFQEVGEISLYTFTLISFILPIFVSITSFNVPILLFFLVLASFILILGSSRTQKVIQLYRQFKHLQSLLIQRQEEKLVDLVCDETIDPLIVHVNRENLKRLVNERSIPTTFPLLPLSMILPIFSAIIGYVILALENAPK
jgi:hypothetical protein